MSSLQYTGGGGYLPYDGGYQPYWSPAPGQPQWMEADALAKKAFDSAKARLEAQRSSIANAAGYLVDPNTHKLRLNTKNEVGGMQMMLRGQAQEDTGMRNQFVNRGIQGSGLQGQAAGQLHVQHGAESAQFANSLQQSLSGIQNQIQDQGDQYAQAKWMEMRNQTMGAIANNQFNNPILPPNPNSEADAAIRDRNIYGTQTGGGSNINMFNNPQFLDFIRQLFAGQN